jgi:hypothetical protein
MGLVTDLTLILAAALAGGYLAQRAGQALIVGYILSGIAVGPFTGGLTVVNIHDIEQLAEIGVALLLFSLGLEVSFRELAPVRVVALAGGTIQVLLTIAFGAGLAAMLGWAWRPAHPGRVGPHIDDLRTAGKASRHRTAGGEHYSGGRIVRPRPGLRRGPRRENSSGCAGAPGSCLRADRAQRRTSA